MPEVPLKVRQVLSDELCKRVTSKIYSLRQEWSISEHGTSLGNAYYKMVEEGWLHKYHAKAAANNIMLTKHFTPLIPFLEVMPTYFPYSQSIVSKPVYPRASILPGGFWSLFGFAIQEASTMKDGDDGYQILHADYEGLSPYPDKLFDSETRAISTIICISAPPFGGGLRVFKNRVLANQELIPGCDHVDVTYIPGQAVMFDSFLPHQILPMKFTLGSQARIVLVTHYLYHTDPFPHWQYWY